MFRDGVYRFLRAHTGWRGKRVSRYASGLTLVMSVVVGFLIIWLFAGPHIMAALR